MKLGLIINELVSKYMYFIQSFKDVHRLGVYDDKICNIIIAILLFLTRSTTPFIERGGLVILRKVLSEATIPF